MELLQRCLTHLKWPITSFPRSVRQKCGPFSFERHYSRFIARTYQVASVVSVHTVPSVPFVLSTRCEHFSARQKKAVNAQQKLNCILQLHIEKLNVKNCCHSWRHSSRSEFAVFFFALFSTFGTLFTLKLVGTLKPTNDARIHKGNKKKFQLSLVLFNWRENSSARQPTVDWIRSAHQKNSV